MKLVTLWMAVVLAGSAQQFVTWNEQKERLINPVVPVVSTQCPDRIVVAEAIIDKRGNVTKVKRRTLVRIPDAVWSQVVALVGKLHYRPLFVGGKPSSVKTVVQVPCRQN